MTRVVVLAALLCACDCEPGGDPTFDLAPPLSFRTWDEARVVDCASTDLAWQATRWWQDQLCPEAIRCAGAGEHNVYPTYEQPLGVMTEYSGDRAGLAYWEPELRRVWIWIAEPGTIDVEFRVTTHELGHALGLAHDLARKSIMYPAVSPEWHQIATHDDLEAMRDRWCR